MNGGGLGGGRDGLWVKGMLRVETVVGGEWGDWCEEVEK